MERLAIALFWSCCGSLVLGATLLLPALVAERASGAGAARRHAALASLAGLLMLGTGALFVRLLWGGSAPAAAPQAQALAAVTAHTGAVLPVAARAIAVVWGVWTVLGLLRLAGAWLALRRIVRRSVPASRGPRTLVDTLAAEAGLARIPVLASGAVAGPMVVGLRRPVILVPPALDILLCSEHVRALLAHEVAHVRRRDPLLQHGFAIARCVLFFNPALRWLLGRAGEWRERACDEEAVRPAGAPVVLARALEQLARTRESRAALALAANDGALFGRVCWLLAPRRGSALAARRLHGAALSVAAILTALLVWAPPADAVDATRLAGAPALRMHQQIQAVDAAGPFQLTVVGMRARAALFGDVPFPTDRIRQRGAEVRFDAPDGSTLLSVRLAPTGGMNWESRAPARPMN